jgi:hypothetical protein
LESGTTIRLYGCPSTSDQASTSFRSGTFGLQPQQRLAHRRPRGAGLLGHLRLAQEDAAVARQLGNFEKQARQ